MSTPNPAAARQRMLRQIESSVIWNQKVVIRLNKILTECPDYSAVKPGIAEKAQGYLEDLKALEAQVEAGMSEKVFERALRPISSATLKNFSSFKIEELQFNQWNRPRVQRSKIKETLADYRSFSNNESDVCLRYEAASGAKRLIGEICESLQSNGKASKDLLAELEDGASISFSELCSEHEVLRKLPIVQRSIRLRAIRNAFDVSLIKDPGVELEAFIQTEADNLAIVALGAPEEGSLVTSLALKEDLYQVPIMLLGDPRVGLVKDLLPLGGLSEETIETLVVLYGGESYSTLAKAKAGALALNSDS